VGMVFDTGVGWRQVLAQVQRPNRTGVGWRHGRGAGLEQALRYALRVSWAVRSQLYD
jgi:hypothetical protein